MATLEIQLFGGFAARDDDGRPVDLPSPKDRAVLAYIAMASGRPVARDKLAGLLWGDSGDRQARDSLKQALVRLRRALGPAAAAIGADRQTITLEPSASTVDVAAFERLLADGGIAALEQATALYRGELLDGLQPRAPDFEDWLLVERQRLRRLTLEALATLTMQSAAQGAWDRAATAAARLLALDPLHEGASRVLMQMHADRGERSQALKLFETLRERLQKELGVAPDAATQQLYRTLRQQRDIAAGTPDEESGEERRQPAPSIAVLPFAIFGDDPEQEYFADGLTEDIITDLSQVSALFVVARQNVFAFKGRPLQVQQAARDLGVRYVLEGSVRKSGGRLRITAQLIDAQTSGHLWAQRYDRSLDDVFTLQDEISKSIVDVLRVKLLPHELATITTHPTENAQAYEFYLMGRSFYLRGIDKRSLRIARDMFAKARDLDPRYARAHAGIAICDLYLSLNDPDAAYEQTLADSRLALQLEPDLAEAHAALGLAHYCTGRYIEASALFERAMALDPNLFEAHFFNGRSCRIRGLRDQAARLFARAAELRPNDYRSLGLLAEEYKALGRVDDFKATSRRCLERVAAEVKAHPDNADAWAFGSTLLAETGDSSRAEAWAVRATIIGADDFLVHYNVARTFALLGRADTAMDWLERAFSVSSVFQRRLAAWMPLDRELDSLRDQPRFLALERRLRERSP